MKHYHFGVTTHGDEPESHMEVGCPCCEPYAVIDKHEMQEEDFVVPIPDSCEVSTHVGEVRIDNEGRLYFVGYRGGKPVDMHIGFNSSEYIRINSLHNYCSSKECLK